VAWSGRFQRGTGRKEDGGGAAELNRENSREAVAQVAAQLESGVSSSKKQQWCRAISGKKKGGKENKRKRKQRRGLLGQEIGLLKANGLGCKVKTAALERKLWAEVWFCFSDFFKFLMRK
jgi:hypothetical protein